MVKEVQLQRSGLLGWFQEPWLVTAIKGYVKWPSSTWRAKFSVLPSLLHAHEAEAMKELLRGVPEEFDEDVDGVDKMLGPDRDVYISRAYRSIRL